MKFTTIYSGENKIEISNTMLGKEIIKVNDEVVSEKKSFYGTDHHFEISENGNKTNCIIKLGFGINGVVFDFYKDNSPIIISERSQLAMVLISSVIFLPITIIIGLILFMIFK